MSDIHRGAVVETEYGTGVVRFRVAGLEDGYWVNFPDGKPGRIFPGHQLVVIDGHGTEGEGTWPSAKTAGRTA